MFNANIPVYPASRDNHAPKRVRELLVSKKERNRLLGLIRREGVTLVPLSLYFNNRGLAKLQIGLAKGKKKADKRQAERDRDWSRQKQSALRGR